jgi:hypothetical protein
MRMTAYSAGKAKGSATDQRSTLNSDFRCMNHRATMAALVSARMMSAEALRPWPTPKDGSATTTSRMVKAKRSPKMTR